MVPIIIVNITGPGGKDGALLSHSCHEETIHVTTCGKLHPL